MYIFFWYVFGLLAGLVVSIFAYHMLMIRERRFTVACNALAYIDEVYSIIYKVQLLSRKKYSADKSKAYSANIATNLVNLEDRLQSSQIKTQISLSYGKNSQQLSKLVSFQEKCAVIASALSRATPDTWGIIDKTITKQLNQVIEPIVNQSESIFIEGTEFVTILRELFRLDYLLKMKFSQLMHKTAVQ